MTDAALTNALAAIDESVTGRESDRDALVRAKCRGLIRGYHARWATAPYRTLSVEETLTAELVNPATLCKSRSFTIAGKVDALLERDGRTVLMDHKTTSQDIGDFDSPYWRQLAIEGQATHYLLLLWLNGRKVDDVIWDCVRKPQIRPKALSKADRQAAVASRQYFHCRLSQESLDVLQTQERETLEMYEARLSHDCTTERPQFYFARRPVPRLDGEIIEYAEELWGHSKDLLFSRQNGKLPPRNSGACLQFGNPCEFLPICAGHSSPDDDKWERKAQVHEELPLLEGDGKNVLTNSRIRCFQTCRRLHHYRYDVGLKRYSDEEQEALYFGQLWHVGLNAWWSGETTFSKETDNGNSTDPVIEIGSGTSQAPFAG